MAEDYSALIIKGFEAALKPLATYEYNELKAVFGDQWWKEGVVPSIFPEHRYEYPKEASDEEFQRYFDISLALKIIDFNWQTVFRRKLQKSTRSWVKETLDYRNKWAHRDMNGDLSKIEVSRCLENLSLICAQFDSAAEAELQKLVRIARYGSEEGSKKTVVKIIKTQHPTMVASTPSSGDIPSWRSIITPHPDVAEGKYRNAEFAADLFQVAKGSASYEYLDPVEFFGRTYVTDGLKNLLVQSLQRITGKGGEPVIELKTAFGGGKTHSMLALLHMFSGKIIPERVPHLNKILQEAGMSSFPMARTAIIVGTALNPASFKRPIDMPGIQVNTVWGEIAYQLAKAANRPELYDIVKEADKKGINPGSEALARLFSEAGPCLILLDEMVAYGRTLYGRKDCPAGTYENFLTFVQSLTEAACHVDNCLIVASIPESDNEIGGEVGEKVLNALTHYFARKETVWKPVASNEGFEVVRRRLFQKCNDTEARDAVCEAFFKMYKDNPDNFPAECRDESYLKRMKDCYPIHPEVFDRLYDDWATLEKFQKTRGVLRLMAAVINDLWSNGDPNPMIMPASISMGNQAIKDELLRYLPGDTWEPIVDNEVDGRKSYPAQLDTSTKYNGLSAARRVSRSLFFGSAPSEGMTKNRGLTNLQLKLACGQPKEQLFKYDDALKDLLVHLSYLYSTANNDRFWFDTRPTLRKMMEEKAARVTREQALDEIVEKLKQDNHVSRFAGVHICPASSLDVPDTMEARLIIVEPHITTDRSDSTVQEKAFIYMQDILANRGSGPRMYKNMLIFSVADNKRLTDCVDEARKLVAWKEIYDEKETKGLTASDIRTVEEGVKGSERTLKDRILQTWCWEFSPSISPEVSLKDIVLSPREITMSGSIAESVERDAIQSELLITKYAPITLRMAMDQFIWKGCDNYSIKDLWKCYCSYCYLPRLANRKVFDQAVAEGLKGKDFFAIADGFIDGKYLNLRLGDAMVGNDTDILVKKDAAIRQINQDKEMETEEPDSASEPERSYTGGDCVQPVVGPFGFPITNPEAKGTNSVPTAQMTNCTSFHFHVDVDPTRAIRDIGRIVDEVIFYLQEIRDSKCTVSLEVNADFRAGTLSADKKRTIEENCRTLGIRDYEFEEASNGSFK